MYLFYINKGVSSKDPEGILYSFISSAIMYILLVKIPLSPKKEEIEESDPDILDDNWE